VNADDVTSFVIPGATLGEQAINLAGALAEIGVVSLTLIEAFLEPGTEASRRELPCRSTDLPAILVGLASSSRLESVSEGFVFWRSDTSLNVRAVTKSQAEFLLVRLRLTGR